MVLTPYLSLWTHLLRLNLLNYDDEDDEDGDDG